MTIQHNTQSTPHPPTPTQPLFLSPDEVNACHDVDQHGIKGASRESLDKIQFLATCLATEAVNFTLAHPHTPQAGLMLTLRVLLPVYEPDDGEGL